MNIGYTTATCDLLHPGHVNFLHSARKMCDFLIVGLTTDTLAASQKRETWFDYEHRKSVVQSLKSVDLVVEHNGESKLTAHRKLKFRTLFIGDDYFNNDEYDIFEEQVCDVKVIYIPRTSSISTTSIISKFIFHKFLSKLSVCSTGVNGPILQYGDEVNNLIFKPISIGQFELDAVDGRDVYSIAEIPHRNWKIGQKPVENVPFLTAVNSYREILINQDIGNLDFIPFLYHVDMFTETNTRQTLSEKDILKFIQMERKYPTKIIWCVQSHCGLNLKDYMKEKEKSNTQEECDKIFLDICELVRKQVNILRQMGVLHNDLHAKNICVDSNMSVYFIDFGWCLSHRFNLSDFELAYLNNAILKQSDWYHFVASLESSLPKYYKLVSDL